MRLIDADAIIKALNSNCKPELCHDYKTAWCVACCPHNDFVDLLEDAPTIPLPQFKDGYKQAILDGKTNFSRPQGEWVFKHNSSDIWCSVCDENFDEIPQRFNYCPNCGADMRSVDKGLQERAISDLYTAIEDTYKKLGVEE